MGVPRQYYLKPGQKLEDKLPTEAFVMLCRMHVDGHNSREICDAIKREYNIDYSQGSVSYRLRAKRAQPYLERFREEYLTKVKQVPIAHKRIRIDDLEKTRIKLGRLIDKMPVQTKLQRDELLRAMRLLNETLCVAREEMEKKPEMVQQISLSSFSNLTDQELQKRKEALIAKETGVRPRGDDGIRDPGERETLPDLAQSPQVFLAPPEELQRDPMPERTDLLWNVWR